MKTVLYYFTGTGNSLAAARTLQEKLTDAELMPIAALAAGGKKITVPAGVNAGIVMPMYCGFLPNILLRFFDPSLHGIYQRFGSHLGKQPQFLR